MVAMTDDLIELIVNFIYLSKPVSLLLVGNFDPDTIPLITICILASTRAGCLQYFFWKI